MPGPAKPRPSGKPSQKSRLTLFARSVPSSRTNSIAERHARRMARCRSGRGLLAPFAFDPAMERTGIEPVASDLQIPGFSVELGQIRSVRSKLRWFGAVEIGYSGTRFGTRFRVRPDPIAGAS